MQLDPKTALIIAALVTILNGLVLAIVRRDLPREFRPAAWSCQ